MTQYACSRCGHGCHHARPWHDRHPAAAVAAGLCALVWMSMMLSVHPVAATAVLSTVVVGAAVYFAHRERRRREALAARADYENARIVAKALKTASSTTTGSREPLGYHRTYPVRSDDLRLRLRHRLLPRRVVVRPYRNHVHNRVLPHPVHAPGVRGVVLDV